MGTLVIPMSSIPDSIPQKIRRAFPSTYDIRQLKTGKDQPEKFLVTVEWNYQTYDVATVTADGDKFVVDYIDDALSLDYFLRCIEGYVSTKNLYWLVVYPSNEGQWSYYGSPTETREEAIEGLDIQVVKATGAMLIAFKAQEWPCLVLKYDQSYAVRGQLPSVTVDTDDMGEGSVPFTNLETYFKK